VKVQNTDPKLCTSRS